MAQRNALLPSAIFRNAERFKNGRNGTLPGNLHPAAARCAYEMRRVSGSKKSISSDVAPRNALLPSAIFRNAERFMNGRNETLPEMCTQLRQCVHVKCVAYSGPSNASLAMRFELPCRSVT